MAELLALEAVHWAAALVPVILLLALFVWLDAFALMNMRELLLLVALGGVAAIASYPVSGRLLDTLPIGFSIYSRFIAPWLEEALKGLVIIGLFRFNRIGYKADALLSGFAVGAGFAVVENIIYLTFFPQYGTGTWLVRGLGTAVMHGTTLAIFAAVAHELAERQTRAAAADFRFNAIWFLPGYVLAVALHLAFNQFPDRPLLAMIGAAVFAPFAVMALFRFGTLEAEKWLVAERAEHQAQVAALRAGNWPDTPAGARVAGLAARLDEETGKRIRRYWELQAWLVEQAEERMLEEVEGGDEVNAEQVRAALAELAGLRSALGKSTFAALRALLPFSRNDYWELDELRQRLSR